MQQFAKTVICLICLGLVSSASFAGNCSKTGLTLSLGASYVAENFDTGRDQITFDESSGLNVKVGYRLLEHVALELDFLNLNGFDGEIYDIEALELTGHTITLSGKFYPVTGKIQPFILFGLGFADLELEDTVGVNYSESNSDPVIRLGAGFDLCITSTVSLYGEVSYYITQDDIEDTDFMPFTAGIKVTL